MDGGEEDEEFGEEASCGGESGEGEYEYGEGYRHVGCASVETFEVIDVFPDASAFHEGDEEEGSGVHEGVDKEVKHGGGFS